MPTRRSPAVAPLSAQPAPDHHSNEPAAQTVIECAPDLIVTAVSESVSRMLGWDSADLLGRHLLDWLADSKAFSPSDINPERDDSVPGDDGTTLSMRTSIRRRDGARLSINVQAEWLPSSDGTRPALTITLIDVTDEGHRDAYRRMVESSADVVLHARSGKIAWASPSLTRVRAKAGTYHWVDVSAGPCRASDGSLDGIVSSGRLADEAVELEGELRRHAERDHLTGVLKREQIVPRLEAAVRLVRPHGRHCGVIFIDVDGLKAVNDRLGHGAGDALLQVVAGRIASAADPDDRVARLGGDEFLVIVEGITNVGQLKRLASGICLAVSESFDLGGTPISPSVSIGATVVGAADDAQSVVSRADRLMYEAKGLGGGRVVARR